MGEDLAPSDTSRRWFGHEPARFAEFAARHRDELAGPTARAALERLAERARSGTVTLVLGATASGTTRRSSCARKSSD